MSNKKKSFDHLLAQILHRKNAKKQIVLFQGDRRRMDSNMEKLEDDHGLVAQKIPTHNQVSSKAHDRKNYLDFIMRIH